MQNAFLSSQKTSHKFITDSKELALFCEGLKDKSYITVDTEFKRERTFWPELCLIQVACCHDVALIDPLASDINLEPLYEIMFSPSILKVFHAGYEDMEIFFHKTGKLPAPIFDTQIAAQLCGFQDSVAYQTLVKSFCDIELDKSQQRGDWTKRPLSQAQKNYAELDVVYLRIVYDSLVRLLQESDRLEWALEEMPQLFAPEAFQREGEDIWKRLKNPRRTETQKTDSGFMHIKELACWREEEARARNLPRSWIISDSEIMLLAEKPPKTLADFLKTKLCNRYFTMQDAKTLFEGIQKNADAPDKFLDVSPKTPPFSDQEKTLLEKLKTLLTTQAEHFGISSTLIATRKDLERFLRSPNDENKILRGWREKVFGFYAAELKKKLKK